MSGSDPRQGGDLFDMAKDGTTMPADPSLQEVLPSVPRPDQMADVNASGAGLGQVDMATAASNATDIPRNPRDIGATGEVITGTGDQLPKEIESKNMHFGANNPASKGDERDAKSRKGQSGYNKLAGETAEVDPAPGEEGDDQDTIRERKGA